MIVIILFGFFDVSYCQYGNQYSGYGNYEDNVCLRTREKLEDTTEQFISIQNTLLSGEEQIGCDTNGEDCSRILFLSQGGPAGLKHPAIFGLYDLDTVLGSRPAYVRRISQQYMFYKEIYDKWAYDHKIERWIVGPKQDDALNAGIFILSQEICPWDMSFGFGRLDQTMYYYDKLVPNTWSERGNGWKIDNDVDIICYNKTIIPKFHCGCERINVTGENSRISEYHKSTLGIYTRVRERLEDGFTAPVYKKDGKSSDDGVDMYLYSHHPSGHLWLVGRTLKTWSLRLNYLSYMKTLLEKNKKGKLGPAVLGSLGHMMCPTDRKQKEEDALEMEIDIPYPKWEYLQSKKRRR